MARYRIKTLPHGTKVYRDPDWNEYRVVDIEGGTYHTDDKDDALDTAQIIDESMKKELAA